MYYEKDTVIDENIQTQPFQEKEYNENRKIVKKE